MKCRDVTTKDSKHVPKKHCLDVENMEYHTMYVEECRNKDGIQ